MTLYLEKQLSLSNQGPCVYLESGIQFRHMPTYPEALLVNKNVWNSYLLDFSRHNDLHSLTGLMQQVNALVIVSIFLANL